MLLLQASLILLASFKIIKEWKFKGKKQHQDKKSEMNNMKPIHKTNFE